MFCVVAAGFILAKGKVIAYNEVKWQQRTTSGAFVLNFNFMHNIFT